MSNTINYKIRPLRQEETFLLREFLYEAIFIPKGIETPSKEVINYILKTLEQKRMIFVWLLIVQEK